MYVLNYLVYGKWNTWSSWSYCSVSCADGIHARTRECIKDNIDDVDCVGSAEQTSSCSPGPCPGNTSNPVCH